jgi:hypothetical protein
MRAAMERRDAAAMVELFAPDAVFRSPVTATPFEGREAVAELMEAVVEQFETWECTDEITTGDSTVLLIRGRIGGRDVDLVDVMRHDEQGRVTEMRVHGRPISGVAAFAAAVGPRLARRRGRLAVLVVTLLARPLPGVLALGDRIISRLALRRA